MSIRQDETPGSSWKGAPLGSYRTPDFKARVPIGYLEPLLWDNDDKNVTLVVDKDKAARHCFHLPSALRLVRGYGKIKTSFFRPGVD